MTPEQARDYMKSHQAVPNKLASILSQRSRSQEECDKLDRTIENIRSFLDVFINELDPSNKDDYLSFTFPKDVKPNEVYINCLKDKVFQEFNIMIFDELIGILLKLSTKKSYEEIMEASKKAHNAYK